MYGYEWTEEYGIYRLTVDAKIQKEIRPVFHEELDFFGMDQYWDYPKDTDRPLLWAEGIRRYVLNGVCVAEAQGGGFYTKPTIKLLTEERLQLQPVDTDRLYEVNRSLMVSLEQQSIRFIQEQHEKYSQKGYSTICAFSGGKDSLVLLDLMAKALAPGDFYVVFSNTGMELSDTLEAVERAKAHWPQLRFEEAKCHMEPTETWDEFGPPGRRMRWCCSVHKSVPTILKLKEITQNYNVQAVVFEGVRAEESAARADRDEISVGAKNINQVNCSPILKWGTSEVFLHLFHNGILLNDAYRIGCNRVGCTICPLSSSWRDSICNHAYHEEIAELLKKVEQYTANVGIQQSQRKKYIEHNGWRTRMGGRGLPNGGNRIVETVEHDSISFILTQKTQDWINVCPILGPIVDKEGDTYTQIIDGKQFAFTVSGDNESIIKYWPHSEMNRFVLSHLRGVANKVAYCFGCKACEVQCPVNAFSVTETGEIYIRQDKCVHCANCIEYTNGKGCLAAKSLSVTGGGSAMELKGMNRYQTFGFRQPWLEHYFNDGVSCFQQNLLGTRQYEALKVWLRESNIISVDSSKGLAPTDLGFRLAEFGPYNPFTWAVIWANLAYNSVIARWYCLNAEIGATYEKGDLVVMIGDDYSQSNRENAISALAETLRLSPIGSFIKQGIPIEIKKNIYSFYREGWQVPDGVALLYSLYLYAEHTGRKAFTFTELANSHSNPDATGISPHDIYGIDVKAFREQIQGLAIAYPKYIHVAFKDNLDNIILEDGLSSLDVLELKKEEQ